MVEIPPRRRGDRGEKGRRVTAPAKRFVGRCGLYCGSCFIYAVSHEPALADRRRRAAAEWNCPEDAVTCEGCGALTPSCWGNDCRVLQCLNGRGLAFCDGCAEIDACATFGDVDGRYDGVPRRNLARRRAVGEDAWLAEQATERACRACGRPVIYGGEKCAYCGAAL